MSKVVHRPERVLGTGMLLFDGFLVPDHGDRVVLLHSKTVAVHDPKVELRRRVALFRTCAIPRHRFLVILWDGSTEKIGVAHRVGIVRVDRFSFFHQKSQLFLVGSILCQRQRRKKANQTGHQKLTEKILCGFGIGFHRISTLVSLISPHYNSRVRGVNYQRRFLTLQNKIFLGGTTQGARDLNYPPASGTLGPF